MKWRFPAPRFLQVTRAPRPGCDRNIPYVLIVCTRIGPILSTGTPDWQAALQKKVRKFSAAGFCGSISALETPLSTARMFTAVRSLLHSALWPRANSKSTGRSATIRAGSGSAPANKALILSEHTFIAPAPGGTAWFWGNSRTVEGHIVCFGNKELYTQGTLLSGGH